LRFDDRRNKVSAPLRIFVDTLASQELIDSLGLFGVSATANSATRCPKNIR
jgi:hypothetical protein